MSGREKRGYWDFITGTYVTKRRAKEISTRQAVIEINIMKYGVITCELCFKEIKGMRHISTMNLDHIIPKSKGGKKIISNLRLAHYLCNKRRGNGDPH